MIADRNLDKEKLFIFMDSVAHEFFQSQMDRIGSTIEKYAEKLATTGTIAYSEKNGILTGVVIGFTFDPNYKTSYITQVFVSPEMRGKHVATKLMIEYIKFCKEKGLSGIWLTTQGYNEAAIKLYESLGFMKDGFHDEARNIIKLILTF